MRFSVPLQCLLVGVLLFPALSARAEDGGKTTMILAVSWQPGFCETRSKKPECKSQTDDRFDARHFTLHGLWKMKASYCGIGEDVKAIDKAGEWLSLPALGLGADTQAELARLMPGVQSGLDRHEWVKHGSCSGLTAEEYFRVSMRLLDELNGSAVQALFAGAIGKTLTQREIEGAFDAGFGPQASKRVKMRCAKDGARGIITELTIGLGGDDVDQTLGAGMAKAGSTAFGCPGGEVDAVGEQ